MSDQPIRYREGQETDLAALLELDNVCFPGKPRYSEDEMRYFAFSSDSAAIVAEADSRLAGFVVIKFFGLRHGDVVTLNVATLMRRRGIGRELMRRAEQWIAARSVPRMLLEVDADNAAALALYEQIGLKEIRHYEHEGRERFVLEKILFGLGALR